MQPLLENSWRFDPTTTAVSPGEPPGRPPGVQQLMTHGPPLVQTWPSPARRSTWNPQKTTSSWVLTLSEHAPNTYRSPPCSGHVSRVPDEDGGPGPARRRCNVAVPKQLPHHEDGAELVRRGELHPADLGQGTCLCRNPPTHRWTVQASEKAWIERCSGARCDVLCDFFRVGKTVDPLVVMLHVG